MSEPRCPSCRTELTLTHALQMSNPWQYHCPECSTPLDAGRSHKIALVATPVLAIGMLALAYGLERSGTLNPLASATFLAALALSGITAAIWLWQKTVFTRRR